MHAYENYSDLFAITTATIRLYRGLPLSDVGSKTRGDILERVVRRNDELTNRLEIFTDPDPGITVKGNRRGADKAPYDYRRGQTRVEVKSAQLIYDTTRHAWCVRFQNVKPKEHDELRLALYAPNGVHIFVQNGLRMSTQGKGTFANGNQIAICGPKSGCWRIALSYIITKLGKQIATIPLTAGVPPLSPPL
jgi:hypothetical protein